MMSQSRIFKQIRFWTDDIEECVNDYDLESANHSYGKLVVALEYLGELLKGERA